MKKTLVSVLILITAGSIIYALFYLCEGKAPVVDAVFPSDYLKKEYELSLTLSDMETGYGHDLSTGEGNNPGG